MAADIEKIQVELSKVSPSFCIAKWSNVTVHLESGTTHSCHHPKVHRVPLQELKNNPAALHNTSFKVAQRKKMINGERPAECDYCWRIEDLKKAQISDRYLKSAADWSENLISDILKDPLHPGYLPRYLEVSFSNKCQFKCSYCTAEQSSSWEEELTQFGNYPNNTGRKINRIIPEDINPYVTSFWEWWPELSTRLQNFRITGGEPLLSPNTFRVLEDLLVHPRPQLSIGINSNLGAPKVIIDKFVKLIAELETKACVREIIIFPSIDAFGKQAEYIRHGLKEKYFWDNIKLILNSTNSAGISIMCTFNALSITTFRALFDEVVLLNRAYQSPVRKKPVLLDVAYLRNPDQQSVKALPQSYLVPMAEIVTHIEANTDMLASGERRYSLELIKTRRILEYMKEPLSNRKKTRLQSDFYEFFSEHDRRRNTDFLKTFPEMQDFWDLCRKQRESPWRKFTVFFRDVINPMMQLIR